MRTKEEVLGLSTGTFALKSEAGWRRKPLEKDGFSAIVPGYASQPVKQAPTS